MATIHGDRLSTLRWLSLNPIKPNKSGEEATEYLLEFANVIDDAVSQRKFSVADRLNKHTGVWLIARMFGEAQQLLQQLTTLDLWRIGRTDKAYSYKSCDWLSVAAWRIHRQRNLRCVFFIREGPTPDIFRRLFLQTSVEDAEQFGVKLEQEIITASPTWWSEGR